MGVWERRYYLVLNSVMRLLLRSPLHGLRSGRVVLLEFRGRRSGRIYRMPVSYWQPSPEEIVCLTSSTWSRWWVNLDGAELMLVLRRQERNGRSTLVSDPVQRRRLVSELLHHNAHDAHHHGVGLDTRGELKAEDLAQLADLSSTKVVSIALKSA
jgi:hypothetical protein